jgi:ubiquinone/menaquinone biosynthesis C-methylase UbiE
VHAGVDFRARRRLLEVGCGVGAQTEILLERFPRLQIEGVDASAAQLARARTRLRSAIRQGRVRLSQAQAAALPFDDGHFDSAFVCWLLEHLKEPVAALREIHRTLARRGRIYCTEVLNSGFYLHPYSPATLQYWFAFNDHQWSLGGDPFVGGKLANYLLAAGFRQVVTRPVIHHFDNRQPRARAEFIEYMSGVLLSGAPGLIAEGRVTPKLVARMRVELERLKAAPDAVIFDVFIQASAEKA